MLINCIEEINVIGKDLDFEDLYLSISEFAFTTAN